MLSFNEPANLQSPSLLASQLAGRQGLGLTHRPTSPPRLTSLAALILECLSHHALDGSMKDFERIKEQALLGAC